MEQAPGKLGTPRHAQKAVWMRGTWGETRKRQTMDSFGIFEDIFSEPVVPAMGESDWLIAAPEKMTEDAIYILPTGFGKSIIFQLFT